MFERRKKTNCRTVLKRQFSMYRVVSKTGFFMFFAVYFHLFCTLNKNILMKIGTYTKFNMLNPNLGSDWTFDKQGVPQRIFLKIIQKIFFIWQFWDTLYTELKI